MPRRVAEEEDWDDDEDRWQADEDDDPPDEGGGDDGTDTVACRYCRRHIPEDSPYCPYCDKYQSEEDEPPAQKPWWFIAGFLVCLYIVFRWITAQ